MRTFGYLSLIQRALLGIALLCTLAPAALAAPVEPPLHMLYSGKNRLVAGTVKEINPPNRLVFERGTVLGGQTDVPELIDVRADTATVNSVAMGEHYVFAYSTIHRDKRLPGQIALNKNGAVLLSSTGLEPAMFRDSAAMRRILAAADSEEKRDSRPLLRLMLKSLKGKDPQLEYLAAAQIALDADLAALLTDKDKAVLRKVVADTRRTTDTRYALLHAAFRYPDLYGEWPLTEAEEVLATTPLDGYSQGPWTLPGSSSSL